MNAGRMRPFSVVREDIKMKNIVLEGRPYIRAKSDHLSQQVKTQDTLTL